MAATVILLGSATLALAVSVTPEEMSLSHQWLADHPPSHADRPFSFRYDGKPWVGDGSLVAQPDGAKRVQHQTILQDSARELQVRCIALLDIGGSQIVLILALTLIFIAARNLPRLAQGLRRGMSEFRDATDEVARDAGQSVGGIYGKPAAEALTPDNKVAELYDPAALHGKPQPGRRLLGSCLKLWLWLRKRVSKWLR